MKKFIAIFIAFFAFSGVAFASFIMTPSNNIKPDTNIVFSNCMTTDSYIILFDNLGNSFNGNNCNVNMDNADYNYITTPKIFKAGSCSDYSNCVSIMTFSDFLSSPFYEESLTYTLNPTISFADKGIFYTRTDGKSDAGLLVASVATATGETTGSIGPIVAIILAIILAFVFIRTIIGLIYETRHKDTKKE